MTLVSVIVSLISLLCGLGLSLWLVSTKDQPWAKRVGISLLATCVGYLLARTTETWLQTNRQTTQTSELSEKVRRLENHTSKFHVYLQSLESANNLPPSPFQALMHDELQDIDDRASQILRGELRLKREEIIPRWEKLIYACKSTVDATNIVSAKDWKEFSPSSGIEVHRDALKKGVKIRRIMIYDTSDPDHEQGLRCLAKPQLDLGIELRAVSIQWIEQSSFLSESMRDLGTIDIVLFDSSAVLMTAVDREKRMTSARLTTDQHLLSKARRFYEKLWNGAVPMPGVDVKELNQP